MSKLSWMTWDEVNTGFKEFDSEAVTIKADALINEACQVTMDDLSGHFRIEALVSQSGVPEQVKRLAIYKCRQLASIIFWGSPTADEKNESASYRKREYDTLLTSIRDGFISVEGYEKPIKNQRIRIF